MVSMFDEAFKQNPGNEELGIQSFFANLRTSNWKAGQQVRHLLHDPSCLFALVSRGEVGN